MKMEIYDYGLTSDGGWEVSEDKFVPYIPTYQNEGDSVKIKGETYLQIHLELPSVLEGTLAFAQSQKSPRPRQGRLH